MDAKSYNISPLKVRAVYTPEGDRHYSKGLRLEIPGMPARQPTLALLLLLSFAAAGEDAATGLVLLEEHKQNDAIVLDWVQRIDLVPGYALVTSHRGGVIHFYRRDAASGALAHKGLVPLAEELGHKGRHLDAFPVLSEKKILYATGYWTHGHSNADGLGLSWYRFDPEKGTAERLGRIESDAGYLCALPGGKHLLLASPFGGTVQRVELDAETGAPKLGAQAKGDGLGGPLQFSPDGKFAYCYRDGKIGCLALGADGSFEPKGSCDAEGLEPKGSIRAAGLGVSPDGRQVYLNLYGYGEKDPDGKFPGYNALGLFSRNAETGALVFVKRLDPGPKMKGINQFVFEADGTRGYFSSGPETGACGVGWFTRDPGTGALAHGGTAPETRRGVGQFAYDPALGVLYVSGTATTKSFWIYKTR